MAFRHARKCTVFTALMLASFCNAQEGFIVQPKMKQASRPIQTKPIAPSSTEVASRVAPTGEPRREQLDSFQTFGGAGETIRWVKRDDSAPTPVVAPQTFISAPAQTRLGTPPVAPMSEPLNFSSDIPTFTSRSASPAPNAVSREEPPAEQKVEGSQRRKMAELVSSRIIASQPSAAPNSQPLRPISASPGWQAIGEQVSKRISRCNNLLLKNAFFSARAEAESGLLELIRAIDKAENRFHCEPAWLAAKQALKEADDFAIARPMATDRSVLRRIVDSHETPILKEQNLAGVAPLNAGDHYRLYALQSLLESSQGHPWASEALYAIGRTYQAQADNNDSESPRMLRERAAVFYRASYNTMPSNTLASNQLGFILLQMDQPIEAKQALIASVSVGATADSLSNLAEASRRLGDGQTMQWAASHLNAMQPNGPPPQVPGVVEVSPQRFAAMSPNTVGPAPAAITR